MESTHMELFLTFLFPRIHDTSLHPRGCKKYPELPCKLTEKFDSHTTDTTPIYHILYTRGGGGGGRVLLMPLPRTLNAIVNICGSIEK